MAPCKSPSNLPCVCPRHVKPSLFIRPFMDHLGEVCHRTLMVATKQLGSAPLRPKSRRGPLRRCDPRWGSLVGMSAPIKRLPWRDYREVTAFRTSGHEICKRSDPGIGRGSHRQIAPRAIIASINLMSWRVASEMSFCSTQRLLAVLYHVVGKPSEMRFPMPAGLVLLPETAIQSKY